MEIVCCGIESEWEFYELRPELEVGGMEVWVWYANGFGVIRWWGSRRHGPSGDRGLDLVVA